MHLTVWLIDLINRRSIYKLGDAYYIPNLGNWSVCATDIFYPSAGIFVYVYQSRYGFSSFMYLYFPALVSALLKNIMKFTLKC